MKHAILRTDKIKGVENRTGIVSVRIPDDIEYLDNGCVAKLENFLEYNPIEKSTKREVYDIDSIRKRPSGWTGDIILIDSPEIGTLSQMYDLVVSSNENMFSSMEAHYNPAGSIARGYILSEGDIFSVTKEVFTSTVGSSEDPEPEVGKVVGVVGYHFVVSPTSSERLFGKIIDKEFYNQRWFYTIEVDSNAIESPSGEGSNVVGNAVVGTATVGG